jgi:hypothetical protein
LISGYKIGINGKIFDNTFNINLIILKIILFINLLNSEYIKITKKKVGIEPIIFKDVNTNKITFLDNLLEFISNELFCKINKDKIKESININKYKIYKTVLE